VQRYNIILEKYGRIYTIEYVMGLIIYNTECLMENVLRHTRNSIFKIDFKRGIT